MNICSICKENFSDFSCNAQPVNDGRCCPRCDDLIVVPLRILEARIGTATSQFVASLFREAIELRELKTQWLEKIEQPPRKICKGPRHPEGKILPLDSFAPRSRWCRLCQSDYDKKRGSLRGAARGTAK
jgi:hypothetical protein